MEEIIKELRWNRVIHVIRDSATIYNRVLIKVVPMLCQCAERHEFPSQTRQRSVSEITITCDVKKKCTISPLKQLREGLSAWNPLTKRTLWPTLQFDTSLSYILFYGLPVFSRATQSFIGIAPWTLLVEISALGIGWSRYCTSAPQKTFYPRETLRILSKGFSLSSCFGTSVVDTTAGCGRTSLSF